MRMQPDPGELLGTASCIDLLVEQLRYGIIIERDADGGAGLAYQPDLFHQQQVVGRRDPEPADLSGPEITQEQQLGPGGRCEPQRRRPSAASLPLPPGTAQSPVRQLTLRQVDRARHFRN